MLHTADSERRQFQQLRAGAEREFQRLLPRVPLVAVSVTTVATPIPRPVLELRRGNALPQQASVLTPTSTFRKRK